MPLPGELNKPGGLSDWGCLGVSIVQSRSWGTVLGRACQPWLHKVLFALAALTTRSCQRTDGRRSYEMAQELEY